MEIPIDHELHLRSFVPKDAEDIAAQANNPSIWINLMDGFPHPYTLKDAEKWISFCINESTNEHFAIIYNGKIAGAIGAQFKEDIYRYNVELGYWLGESFWGRGIMTRVIAKFTKHLFKTHKINRVFAHVFPTNKGSYKILKKNGFQKEGSMKKAAFKNGYFIDVDVYAKLKLG